MATDEELIRKAAETAARLPRDFEREHQPAFTFRPQEESKCFFFEKKKQKTFDQ